MTRVQRTEKEPTEAASHIRVFVDALERLGYDINALLGAAGLSLSDLVDPDARISCAAVGAMFGKAMQEHPIKNLGVRIAAETPIGAFPLLDYVVLTSETVSQGLKQLARYYRLVDFPVLLHLHDDEDPIRAVYEGPPRRLWKPKWFQPGSSVLRSRKRTTFATWCLSAILSMFACCISDLPLNHRSVPHPNL